MQKCKFYIILAFRNNSKLFLLDFTKQTFLCILPVGNVSSHSVN